MFPAQKRMFPVQKHVFSVQKHMFSVQKHKKPHIEKTFFYSFRKLSNSK